MRLINADEHECWACVHHQNESGKCDTWCDSGEAFELSEDVKNAKTAYDVEKVMRDVEKWIDDYDDIKCPSDVGGLSVCDFYETCDNCHKQWLLRIIRNGGQNSIQKLRFKENE